MPAWHVHCHECGMSEFTKTIDRLTKEIESFAAKFVPDETLDSFLPSADLVDAGTEYRIRLDVPGITKDQLNVDVSEGTLTVRGERAADDSGTFLKRERRYGAFLRSFTLPDAVTKKDITARFKDGVLTLTVKKTVVDADATHIDIQD
jgi:HSP20 family protein